MEKNNNNTMILVGIALTILGLGMFFALIGGDSMGSNEEDVNQFLSEADEAHNELMAFEVTEELEMSDSNSGQIIVSETQAKVDMPNQESYISVDRGQMVEGNFMPQSSTEMYFDENSVFQKEDESEWEPIPPVPGLNEVWDLDAGYSEDLQYEVGEVEISEGSDTITLTTTLSDEDTDELTQKQQQTQQEPSNQPDLGIEDSLGEMTVVEEFDAETMYLLSATIETEGTISGQEVGINEQIIVESHNEEIDVQPDDISQETLEQEPDEDSFGMMPEDDITDDELTNGEEETIMPPEDRSQEDIAP